MANLHTTAVYNYHFGLINQVLCRGWGLVGNSLMLQQYIVSVLMCHPGLIVTYFIFIFTKIAKFLMIAASPYKTMTSQPTKGQ